MRAVLSDGYREAVLWHDTAGSDTTAGTPPAALPRQVDVAVVGSGYCGVAAALELARRGRSVAVLERGAIGAGASTRNGGMVLPELKHGPRTLAARYGTLGERMHAAVEDAFDHVEALIDAETIDCDYERSGQLYLATGARSAAGLRSLADEHASVGNPARVVSGDELAKEIGSTLFPAGLVIERSGGLHPARFHAGLVRAAVAEGVTLHANTAVTAIASRPSGARVDTAMGPIDAGAVLLAVNAHADGAAPRLRRRVLPMGSYIIATEPLDDDRAEAVLPTRRMAFDTKNLLWYWRLDPDGRLVFGGRKGLGRVSVAEARDHLYAAMVQVYPQLAGVAIERAWGGRVAITADRLPHCGRIDGAWYAAGCNGSGVALMTWLGHRMAAAMCGEPLPVFAELPNRRFPLHAVRALWLPAASLWLRAQDRRG